MSQNHSLVFSSMELVIVRNLVVILMSYVLSYDLICQLQNIISFRVYLLVQWYDIRIHVIILQTIRIYFSYL